ncbi:hypothetical protein FRC17_009349 [Serendipita sp. 399]|nr:hypothetical protein FRC17_009349 [Serendipita sp. 399]
MQAPSTPTPAHVRVARNSTGTAYPMTPIVISHQPVSSNSMSLGGHATGDGEERQQTVDGVMRLRGGCIPTEVAAGSSPSLAAAEQEEELAI